MLPARRAGSPVLVRAGVICFALGLIAVVVIFAMFAAGAHDLPLWLNLAAMLAPAGFGLALIGLFRQARRSAHPRSASTVAPPPGPAPTGPAPTGPAAARGTTP